MNVIFLAFANSASNPLEHLTAEDNAIYETLSKRYASGDYFLHRESFATPESIIKSLDKYKDDLAIFHFSGHAGSDQLLVNDQSLFSKGIAKLLEHSAKKGVLKLVVLNGCSTCAQVKLLMQSGVPVVVSTSAPVNDKSAKEFAIRFWEKIAGDLQISEAYDNALAVANSFTAINLTSTGSRHLAMDDDDECAGDDKPLWRLDAVNEYAIKLNPLPYKPAIPDNLPKPNEELIDTLYNSFREAKNPQIDDLWRREENGDQVSDSAKQIAIVNSIPYPMGVHLQKLICPTADTDDEGYDVFGTRRLKQVAELFQITTEFLGIIMIAQIWELFVRFPQDFVLSAALKLKLNEYLKLDEKEREVYAYIPLIRQIREYLENFQPGSVDLKNFLDEQEIFKDLFLFDDHFMEACNYLVNLRVRTMKGEIDEARIITTSLEAEKQLCVFVKSLGFIHRYQLTSVQNIDILKFRHTSKVNTKYKHRIIRCMQAIGKDEWNYYYMTTFLDNWGVILLKCEVKVIDGRRKQFEVNVKDFLNLSPFVIDRNAFIDRADLAYIMFFKGENDKALSFKRVKNPLSLRDAIEIKKVQKEEDRFDAIRIQFNAFKEFIA